MRHLLRTLVLLVGLALITTGCVPVEQFPWSPRSTSARGTVTQGHTTVTASRSDVTVTVAAPDLAEAWTPLREVAAADLLVGVPIEVTASENGTFVLERTYAAPLPDDADAIWGYFDAELSVWVPVPSTLSDDRTTLRAEVDHLSLWNDFISGTEGAISSVKGAAESAGRAVVDVGSAAFDSAQKATEWVGEQFVKGAEGLSHGVAAVFDVRVDPPECTGTVPEWVTNVVHIETYFTNPIHWCVGRDETKPSLLVVKARVSRGFGYGYETAAAPAWSYNSTDRHGHLTTLLRVSGELGGTMAGSVSSLTFGGQFVGAGEEISFGFEEKTVRAALKVGKPLVELKLPGTGGFLFSVIARITVSQATDLVGGQLGALLALATCANAVSDGAGVTGGVRTTITCLASQSETVAAVLASSLGGKAADPKALGKAIGTSIGRATFYLALVGPTQSVIDYGNELALPPAARQLSISLSAPPATIKLGEGSGVTINGKRHGRGGASEIQALVKALGSPDSQRILTCEPTWGDMTERRWGGLAIISLNKDVPDDQYGPWKADGIAGWRLESNTPGVTGPKGIVIGTPGATVRQKYRADDIFSVADGNRSIEVFAGDTVDATFTLDAQGRVSAMSSGFGCRK